MNIVIIYENMGMGHLRMARIIGDALVAGGHQARLIPGSELVDDKSVYLINRIWNQFIKNNWIKSVDLLLNFLGRVTILPTYETIYYRRFSRRLDELKPDIVISTADVYNKALSEYAEERGIPFYLFITDCSIFYDLASPQAIHVCYFPETAQAVRALNFDTTYYTVPIRSISNMLESCKYVLNCWRDILIGKQIVFQNVDAMPPARNNARTHIVGPLVPLQHYERRDRAAIRLELSIPADQDTVLVASGSIGGKIIATIVEQLCRTYPKPLTILAMCGNDHKLLDRLRVYRPPRPAIQLLPYGYQADFGKFLAASDCVIARPSAGLFTEAIRYCVPLIVMAPMPSNDKGTAVLIQKYQAGKVCQHPRDIADMLNHILQKKNHYLAHLERLRAASSQSYAEQSERLRAIILGELSEPVIEWPRLLAEIETVG